MALGSLWQSVNRVRNGIAEKRCSRCGKWRAATADHFHRRAHRLHSECKPCANRLAREYQLRRYVPASCRAFDASALERAMRRPR